MAVTVTINGTAQGTQRSVFALSQRLNERDRLTLSLFNVRPATRQTVLLAIGGINKFGGTIQRVSEQDVEPSASSFFSKLEAIGHEALYEKIPVTESYTATTLKVIITDLVTKYLAASGFTVDPTMADGPTLSAQEYEQRPLIDIFRELTFLAGASCRTSPTKVISWKTLGADAAPISVTDANVIGEITVDYDDTEYYNRVTVLAGDPQNPFIATVSDNAEIAAHGLSHKIVRAPDNWSSASASAMAAALLSVLKVSKRTLHFVLEVNGFAPGQLVSVASTARNLAAADYVVQSVEANYYDSQLRYTIVATLALHSLLSDMDAYRSWGGARVSSTPVAIAATAGSAMAVYPFGGSPESGVSVSSVPGWVEFNGQPVRLDGNLWAGRVVVAIVRVRALTGGISVTPRIWNTTADSLAGSGALYTGTGWSDWQIIVLTIAAGVNNYVLQLSPSAVNEDVYAQGFVETH